MVSCDLELSVASASWSIVTLFRGRRVTEARYEQAGMMIAEADRRVEGGLVRVGVMDRLFDRSSERVAKSRMSVYEESMVQFTGRRRWVGHYSP